VGRHRHCQRGCGLPHDLPWIALSLALTFGFYGLLKKRAPLPADTGLTLETLLMAGPALIGMILLDVQGQGGFFRHGAQTDILLLLSGPITAVPLLMFAGAAKTIPLSMLGVLQYIAPTGQFLVAVFLYGEPFPTYKLITCALLGGRAEAPAAFARCCAARRGRLTSSESTSSPAPISAVHATSGVATYLT